MNSGTREDLEWFRPSERNTLLHFVLDCCESLRAESLSLSSVCPFCNVACLPFYNSRGGEYKGVEPRYVGLEI
jgi:hypothetical protein